MPHVLTGSAARVNSSTVGDWLAGNGSRIGSVHQLQPPGTATTVLLGGQRRPVGAWLLTVARRRALNRLSRDARYAAKLAQLAREPDPGPAPEPDDRLRLVFTCCHPALRREWQVALTLRAVFGFTTGEIARAFVASEDGVAQRIVRAKRKITTAGIPYRMPGPQELPTRLPEVLAVLYLMFNQGHLATSGSGWWRDLSQDALWLAGLLCRLLPGEPEALGLAALMRLHLARASTRFTGTGDLVRLADQDRALWDHDAIEQAVTLIERAAALRRPGPYQVEAAIAACHAEAASFEATDWLQVVALYDLDMSCAIRTTGHGHADHARGPRTDQPVRLNPHGHAGRPGRRA